MGKKYHNGGDTSIVRGLAHCSTVSTHKAGFESLTSLLSESRMGDMGFIQRLARNILGVTILVACKDQVGFRIPVSWTTPSPPLCQPVTAKYCPLSQERYAGAHPRDQD